MPLVGSRCEMTGEPKAWDDCLECSRTRHPCQFSYEFLRAMAGNAGSRKKAGVSVTTCTGCARQGYYNLALDYYQYPHLLWPATRGTIFHDFVESHPEPDCIYEHRFARELNGVRLTGQVDKLKPSELVVVDFKSKDKLPDDVPEGFVWQTNGYRLLLQSGTVVSNNRFGHGVCLEVGSVVSYDICKLGLILLTMQEVKKVKVPILPLDEVEAYFAERAGWIQRALDGERPPPRQFQDPTRCALCRDWCPFVERCVRE